MEQLSVYSGPKKLTVVLRERSEADYTYTLRKRWEEVGLRPGFDPERGYMESFAEEVSRIGRLLVSKGTEEMTPFEQYWAQYDGVPELE